MCVSVIVAVPRGRFCLFLRLSQPRELTPAWGLSTGTLNYLGSLMRKMKTLGLIIFKV